MRNQISIGQVKRDISALVNRVAFGGERIVLTSRGKPKAALVSLEDLERLKSKTLPSGRRRWEEWHATTEELSQRILEDRQGQLIEIDEALAASRKELEERDERVSRS